MISNRIHDRMTGHKDHSLASFYVGSSQRDVVTIVHGFELGDVVGYSVPHIGSCARRISLSYAIRALPNPIAMALLSTQLASLHDILRIGFEWN